MLTNLEKIAYGKGRRGTDPEFVFISAETSELRDQEGEPRRVEATLLRLLLTQLPQ